MIRVWLFISPEPLNKALCSLGCAASLFSFANKSILRHYKTLLGSETYAQQGTLWPDRRTPRYHDVYSTVYFPASSCRVDPASGGISQRPTSVTLTSPHYLRSSTAPSTSTNNTYSRPFHSRTYSLVYASGRPNPNQEMSYSETEVHYDSNWTLMYVILAAIPIVFIGSAVISQWRQRMTRRQHDIEIAKQGARA
ncbi:hypothetical protein GGR57DRAFT_59355 [Xylariaceae sp. FL1272]|nr:hypothetical protein GGR57DRAFT_59355 [Xylariaceae sp. FL1272]